MKGPLISRLTLRGPGHEPGMPRRSRAKQRFPARLRPPFRPPSLGKADLQHARPPAIEHVPLHSITAVKRPFDESSKFFLGRHWGRIVFAAQLLESLPDFCHLFRPVEFLLQYSAVED